jgi:hypothetical protein
MIKKGYIMIALALVSVLLGSLFYNNITQAQRLRVYKDVVEIAVLDRSRIYENTEYGIPVYIVSFSFAFTPKQRFLNVTKLALNIIVYPTESTTVNASINGVLMARFRTGKIGYLPMYKSVWTSEPNVCVIINHGINWLTIEPLDKPLYMLKITLLIEYEYQAR